VIASSSVGAPAPQIPTTPSLLIDGVAMSPIRLDKDRLPTAVFGIHLARESGWLIGEISLEEMWRMVDRIRIGGHGYALIVAPDGTLVARRSRPQGARRFRATWLATPGRRARGQRRGTGVERVSTAACVSQVATGIPPLGWTVIGAADRRGHANAPAQRQLSWRFQRRLVMLTVTWRSGDRSSRRSARCNARRSGGVRPTEARVTSDRRRVLGPDDAFNTMANRLVQLQKEIKLQERQATIGRIASGLVHDLTHPIANLGNNLRLLTRDDIDAESRRSSRTTIERELETLKRFMDDLRHVVKPQPVERFLLDVNSSLVEVVEAMRYEGVRAGVSVETCYAPAP
jgi:signal transduction histidine kinase